MKSYVCRRTPFALRKSFYGKADFIAVVIAF